MRNYKGMEFEVNVWTSQKFNQKINLSKLSYIIQNRKGFNHNSTIKCHIKELQKQNAILLNVNKIIIINLIMTYFPD